MQFIEISDKLIEMKKKDLELRAELIKDRSLYNGYNPAMEKLHDKHAAEMNAIIDKIGFPTEGKVGAEGVQAAWLIIQHAINHPALMKRYHKLMESEIKNKNANPMHYAYLTDRIAVFEGKPQLYGTQFDWDSFGNLSPCEYDDIDKVNLRRKSISLNTLEEQTLIMRDRAISDNEQPPNEYTLRIKEYNKWRKEAGWI